MSEVCFKHPESIYPRGGMFLSLTRESRYGERKYTHTGYYVAVVMHDTCDTGYLTIRFSGKFILAMSLHSRFLYGWHAGTQNCGTPAVEENIVGSIKQQREKHSVRGDKTEAAAWRSALSGHPLKPPASWSRS